MTSEEKYQLNLKYLLSIGCAEHYDEKTGKTEYWFRVRERGGRWNGKWSMDWKGSNPDEMLTTEELARYMSS